MWVADGSWIRVGNTGGSGRSAFMAPARRDMLGEERGQWPWPSGVHVVAVSKQATRQPVIDKLDQERWRCFVEIYDPLIYRYARLRGLSHEDAREVVQECMTLLVRQGPDFDHEREPERFKAWLRRVAANKIIDMFKRKRPTHALPDSYDPADRGARSVDAIWEEQWMRKHLRSFLKQILSRAAASTRHAFQLHVVSGWPVEEVAETLSISVDQVYAARSRITSRLQAMARDVLGDDFPHRR